QKKYINALIEHQGTIMEDLLSERREQHSDVMQWARQTVRTAVLASWPRETPDHRIVDGRIVEGFDPAAKRGDIEKLLKEWGFDVERFAPEIDEVLYSSTGPSDMQRWRGEAVFSQEGREAMRAKAAKTPACSQKWGERSTGSRTSARWTRRARARCLACS